MMDPKLPAAEAAEKTAKAPRAFSWTGIKNGLTKFRAAPGMGVLLAYLSITFFLTHVNISGTMLDYKNYPAELGIIDKVYHFCSYSILTFLVLFAFTKPVDGRSRKIRLTSAKRLLLWCSFVVAHSIFDESTQPLFGRSFEVFDMLANCIGIAFGQILFVVCEATGYRKKLMRMM